MSEIDLQRSEIPGGQRALLLDVTGRTDLADALRWIAEERPLRPTAVHELLGALVMATEAGLPGAAAALRAAGRQALTSMVDTSRDLLHTDTIIAPQMYDDALAAVASFTPTGSLTGITVEAVAAAASEHPHVIEALGQVAGLAWRDLRDRASERGVTLPTAASGPWLMSQLTVVLGLVDEVVRGAGAARIQGAVPARPIELLVDTGTITGWGVVERMRRQGVSYGFLLAQRDVGGSWGAHRNRTANEVSRIVTAVLLEALDAAHVPYWSTAGPTSERVPRRFLAGLAARTGTTPGQLSVVTRGDDGSARLAIFLAAARDGGTARKTGSTLLKVPSLLKIPGAVVLVGPGWADRGESDDLVRAFSGRVFTDQTLTDLAALASTRSVGSASDDGAHRRTEHR